jgi:hypothetical protein
LVVVVGQQKALGIAVGNEQPQRRYSGLLARDATPMALTYLAYHAYHFCGFCFANNGGKTNL